MNGLLKVTRPCHPNKFSLIDSFKKKWLPQRKNRMIVQKLYLGMIIKAIIYKGLILWQFENLQGFV